MKVGKILLVIALLLSFGLASAATAVLILVPEKPLDNSTINYGPLVLKAQAFFDQNPALGVQVNASSDSFGSIELFDDGLHNDNDANDGVYANTAIISKGAGKKTAIEFTATADSRLDKKIIQSNITDDLQITLNKHPDAVILGQAAEISGTVLKNNAIIDANGVIVVKIAENIEKSINFTVKDSNFAVFLDTSTEMPEGDWLVKISITDAFGNNAAISGTLRTILPGIAKNEIMFSEPFESANIQRSSSFRTVVRISSNEIPALGAKAIASFGGKEFALSELGNGIYSGIVGVSEKETLGKAQLCVEAVVESNGVFENLKQCENISVTKAGFDIKLAGNSGNYYIGEENALNFTIFYSGSQKPVDSANVECNSVKARILGPREFNCIILLKNEGIAEINVKVNDAFGNAGSKKILVNAKAKTMLEASVEFAKNYGILVIALALIACFAFLNSKGQKLKRLSARKADFEKQLKKAQEDFYKKKTINEAEYERISKNQNSMIEKLDEEMKILKGK